MYSKPRVFRLVAGLAALACLALVTLSAQAATYYVRPDGGAAAQCNGTVNAPASAAPNCAWSAPTIPLPTGSLDYGGTIPPALIKSGDTLVINSGSYMVGYGAIGTPGSLCTNTGQTYECGIASVPSGIDAAHPTVIQGDCTAPPELWGTQGVTAIFVLLNKHDVRFSCLDLTDHSICLYNYGPTSATGGVIRCPTNYPYGTFASRGFLVASFTNLTMDRVTIHGFAKEGVLAGQLHGNTLLSNVTIRANGFAGWNGDLSGLGLPGGSSNDGTLTFNNINVSWNGCGEAYPATTIVGCWGQSNGGYGDGFGMAATAGDWIFNNATFYQNTSDGLDLLYHTLGGSITINGGNFSGSIGNQIKVAGNATIQNAVVNGYCNNFAQFPVGGAGGNSSNNCRAAGTAIVMVQEAPNQTSTIRYSTITGDGDTLLVGKGSESNNYVPVASNIWQYQNNIFLGQASAYRTGYQTGLDWYSDNGFGGTVKYVSNIVWNVRYNACPATSICKDPQLVNETLAGFSWNLLPSSPAINSANAKYLVPVDYYGTPRPLGGGYDIGAVEYRGQAWLGNDNPPVPVTGSGTQSASGVPPQQLDAPVAAAPGSGNVQSGSRAGWLLPFAERRLAPPGDGRFGNAVSLRDARVIRADWLHESTSRGTLQAADNAMPMVATTAPMRAADAAKPAVAPDKAQQVVSPSYWIVLVNWFQDFYHRLAMR